jgi:hypothetical protein
MSYPKEKVPDQYRDIYEEKVGRLAENLSPLLEELGDVSDPVFVGTVDDITTIGVIYYHDLAYLIDERLLEEGAVFVLSYILVNCNGFKWEAMDSKSNTLTHPKLEKPVVFTPEDIRTNFPVRDVDDGEVPDFYEYISEAYERLVYSTGGKQRKREMRGFLP